jgi:hypothetical protein
MRKTRTLLSGSLKVACATPPGTATNALSGISGVRLSIRDDVPDLVVHERMRLGRGLGRAGYERDHGRILRWVTPRVPRPVLYHDVARLELSHIAVVELEDRMSLQHDPVIDLSVVCIPGSSDSKRSANPGNACWLSPGDAWASKSLDR